MLASTLLFATLLSSLFTAGSASLSAITPTGLVQCATATLGWQGGVGPYEVHVFTGCDDPNDEPLASWYGVTGTSTPWYVNGLSGYTIFLQISDSTGATVYSGDGYIGGNAGQAATTCEQHLQQSNLLTVSYNLTADALAAAASSSSAAGSLPTTQSIANGIVANAEATATSGTPSPSGIKVAGALGNGAGTSAAPSVELAIGLMGAALLLMI